MKNIEKKTSESELSFWQKVLAYSVLGGMGLYGLGVSALITYGLIDPEGGKNVNHYIENPLKIFQDKDDFQNRNGFHYDLNVELPSGTARFEDYMQGGK